MDKLDLDFVNILIKNDSTLGQGGWFYNDCVFCKNVTFYTFGPGATKIYACEHDHT